MRKSFRKNIIIPFLIMGMAFSLAGCSKDKKPASLITEDDSREADSITTEEVVEKTVDSAVIKDETVGTHLDSEGYTVMDDYVVTIDDNVNVRVDPSKDADIYMILVKGVDLHRTGTKDGWTRVRLNSTSFYVSSNLVEKTEIKWATPKDAEKVTHVVYIDPAKQIAAMEEMENIAPSSDKKKAKMSPANEGVRTANFEYEMMLDLAVKVKTELVNRNYEVILSRDTSTAEISNKDRALNAVNDKTEVYIKLQAGSASSEVSGVMGFITTSGNKDNGDDYAKSRELCNMLLNHISEDMGLGRRGIVETDDLTSLNYCTMPATVINTGFLSNESDDVMLSTKDDQDKMAKAIADAIDEYFKNQDSKNKKDNPANTDN